MTALLLGGCMNNSANEPASESATSQETFIKSQNELPNEVLTMESLDENEFELGYDEQQETDAPQEFTRVEGTYEYKNHIFEVIYNTDSRSEWFHVDNNSLNKEPGLSLYNAAFHLVNAFANNDTEELRKHFENEEDFNKMIDFNYMSSKVKTSEHSLDLRPYNIIGHVGEDGFDFIFGIYPEDPDMESLKYIYVYMYLNENDEWKTSWIGTGY